VKLIKFAVRIDSLPNSVSNFSYDPDRAIVSYVPVRQLSCILPGRKLPPETVQPPNSPKQGD
jgi:hypothetical protein